MKRKLLFIIFTTDECKRNHAFLYARHLTAKGHSVRIILEGAATASIREATDASSVYGRLLHEAVDQGMLIGACQRAAEGCGGCDPTRQTTALLTEHGIPLLNGMDGHAPIDTFLEEGYEIVTF